MPRAPDVLIVGGGLVGASVAFEVRALGLTPLVVDADLPGAAWRAGAGLLTPDGERLRGTPLHADALESLRLWPDLARRLEAASGRPVHLRAGVTRVARTAQDAHALHDEAAGNPVEAPPPFLAARATPGEGRVHPPSVVLAALHGVPVLRAQVRGLRPQARGVRVHTSAGPLTVPLVVLAAGAWSGAFGLPVRAAQGQALLLDGPHDHLALYARRGYALGRPDGLYVGATTRATAAPTPDAHAERWLRTAARHLTPGYAPAPAQQHLVGLRPVTPGGLPILGPHPTLPNVLVATGHGRHGALLAPLTARRVAALVARILTITPPAGAHAEA
ncbi:NAD(P)/FAD-dependent oxidoreductase [Deinococcus maricopensis]|uniref:FAD dependent oxidoreductase n=1 Tax=Deinococcus maricopensis (strain DSM 21211 / LMG 22137 / NRRL B-23946 / LB-34) TaxID=709986 RepID=E8U9V9_DEIML|nr:FAD-binding oxidoreductase [Deinococcus maricopensis]ADV67848.1 FAD dependent oxidoreductase [Deinococcus maricopensis DSM 21211]